LKHIAAKETAMAKDPVCGMTVDENRAPARSTYQGQTFYFCSQECKDKFDHNPETYADRARTAVAR
jgi:YHS domain-containing protein